MNKLKYGVKGMSCSACVAHVERAARSVVEGEVTVSLITNSIIIEKQFGHRLMVQTDYNGIGKLQYLAAQSDLKLLTTDYTDVVTCTLFVTPDAEPGFLKKWNEQTSGQSLTERLEPCFCALLDGSPVIFPE